MADLYTDNDVPLRLASQLQAQGHTVVTVRGLGTRRAGDDQHLLTASQQGRIFITHNAKDFILLHNAWRRWSTAWGVTVPHAGILVIPQRVSLTVLEAEILTLLRSGRPLVNTLYSWEWGRGWVLVP